MNQQYHLLATKLEPPRLKSQYLRRKRLDQLFRKTVDYPVTLVQADAGYGKSTALTSHLCSQFEHVAWFTVEKADRDLSLFLQYLIHAAKKLDSQIGERSLRLMKESESAAAVVQPCMTLFINDLAELAPDPTILVLDDFQTVSEVPEIETAIDLLIRYLPSQVHLVIGSRKAVEYPSVRRLHTMMDLQFIGKKELSFTQAEIEELFAKTYGIYLKQEHASDLFEQTEGWAIALQMIWKGLEKGILLPELWREPQEPGKQLFHYLAEEVFDRQPDNIRLFLERTCILETMEPEICDILTENGNSKGILEQLEKEGLFVEGKDSGHYRYHRLFQKFLLNRAKSSLAHDQWALLHKLSASFFSEREDLQLSLHHYSEAGSFDNVVKTLLETGSSLLESGRLVLLKKWIDKLPSSVLQEHPKLLYWQGEIERISSRYAEAEHWYRLAEGACIQKQDIFGRSQAYLGQAQMYLDTIQPNRAVPWLKMAIEVLGDNYSEERAKLLRLLAENHMNSGFLKEAKEITQSADLLVPRAEYDELDIRIHLRTGNLEKAKEITQDIISKEMGGGAEHRRNPRFHREMHLLMSLIEAFRGEQESSRWHAEQGIQIGRELQSPFVEMVGYMRLGHAYGMAGRFQEAQNFYLRSIQMSEDLLYERGKVEAYMGLCTVAGLAGELDAAEKYAQTGLDLALHVHDRWCANLIRLSYGSTKVIWGQYEEALPWLLAAEEGFTNCGDSYCLAKVQLWLGILFAKTANHREFAKFMPLALKTIEERELSYLIQKRTLFGPNDLQLAAPALIMARDELQLETAEKMLRHMGCKGIQKHPGYTLRIYALGSFTVYRGIEEIGRKEWKREKSRQLFQLFVTRPGHFLQRDEICDLLWPEADEATAHRDFKVAMNALANAIEPEREARSESFFIERVQTAYRLNPEVAVWIDAEEFKEMAEKGLAAAEQDVRSKMGYSDQVFSMLESALNLYRGDYLRDYPYEEWCGIERNRLKTLYVRVLEKIAVIYQTKGLIQETITCCERILASDPCWESAYQVLLSCYHLQGNRSLVISTYQKCVMQMEDLLGLSPSAETNKLYQRYVRGA